MRRNLTLTLYAALIALAGFGVACSRGPTEPAVRGPGAPSFDGGYVADGGLTGGGGGGTTTNSGPAAETCADSLRNADGTCRGVGAGSGN